MDDHNQIEIQEDSHIMSIGHSQQMPAEPEEMPADPPPQQANENCAWTFPDISTIFGGSGSSQLTTPPILPSLNGTGQDTQMVSPLLSGYLPPEHAMYVPYEISHNPHLVIDHLTTLLSHKDRQLKAKSAELLQHSTMTRNLTLQLLETQNENIKLRRRMLNVNQQAMTYLEDYPPEVNAHLSSSSPRTGC